MSTQSKDASGEAVNKAMEAFTANFGTNFDSIMRANAQAGQLWMENCSKIGRELMNFANDRWSKDLEAFKKLSECRDPFQAFQLQADCMQTMMRQYMDEAAKVTDMATDAGVSCFKSLDEGVRTAANGGKGASKSDS